MNRLQVRLLGGFDFRDAAGARPALPSRKVQGLVAYLARKPGDLHTRDHLASLLWSEFGDDRARASLRQALSSLRQCLGSARDALLVERNHVALASAAVAVDVVSFEHRLADAPADTLAATLESYQGPLLEGFTIRAPLFDEWARAERDRLHERVLDAFARLLARHEIAGRVADAVSAALRLLSLDRTHEEAHRALIRLYTRMGRRGAALRQYEACATALREDLGVEPSAATQDARRNALLADDRGGWAGMAVRDDAVGQWVALHSARPCVARDEQVETLQRFLTSSATGEPGVLVVSGESGIGKSRLAGEFGRRARASGFRLLLARCRDTERMLPFAPWFDALRAGEPRDAQACWAPWHEATEAVGKLSMLQPGTLVPQPGIDLLRLFDSVLRTLEAMAHDQPLAIVFEDLQWADSLSLRLLSYVAVRLGPNPLAIIATVCNDRVDEMPGVQGLLDELTRHGGLLRIGLSRLARAESDHLVTMLLGAECAGDTVLTCDVVWDWARGNPFLISETVSAISDRPEVTRTDAASVPDRLYGLVCARLKRLSAPAEQMLALAAIAGPGADLALLVNAAGQDEAAAVTGIIELLRRGILSGGADCVEFVHDAFRRAAMERLLPLQARLVHDRLAAALESLAEALRPEQALALGRHHFAAGNWRRATDALRRTGNVAIAQSAYREAVALLEQALEANQRRERSDATMALEVDIRVEICRALMPSGAVRQIGQQLAHAEAAAGLLGDRMRLAQVLTLRTNEAWIGARYAEARSAAERAAAIADERQDPRLRIAVNFYLGQIHHFRGNYARAAGHFRASAAPVDGVAEGDRCGLPGIPAAIARAWLVWSLAELGEILEAETIASEAMALADGSDHPFTQVDVYRAVGIFHLRRGAVAQGLQVLGRGMAVSQARELTLWYPSFSAALGHGYTLAGDARSGVTHCQAAIDQAAVAGILAGDTLRRAWLGRALLSMGRLETARVVTVAALHAAPHNQERGGEAWLLQLLGDIDLQDEASAPLPAIRRTIQALQTARGLGMRLLVAHCHRTLSQLSGKAGRPAAAGMHLRRASRLFSGMNVSNWLTTAEP